jgi:hypothetical protein
MSLHPFRSLDDLELALYQCEDDKTERRAWADRRQFSYSTYIPERRIGQERRQEPDRSNSNRSQ